MNVSLRALWCTAFALGMGISLPTWATNNVFPTTGAMLVCSGSPYYDVQCSGADPTGVADSTTAIQNAINTAVSGANGVAFPLRLSPGTYKVSSELVIDYAGVRATGFQLISDGAVINGRSIGSTPVLQVQCGGGTPSAPATCFYFHQTGTLFINGGSSTYSFLIGKADFSDQHNSIKIDHMVVNNAGTADTSGACQFNAIYDSDIYAVCDAAGGAAGIALEQTQFSKISGAGSANSTLENQVTPNPMNPKNPPCQLGSAMCGPGTAFLIENGYSFSNTIYAVDLEASPQCIGITTIHNSYNTFISPYLNCNTAVNATTPALGTVLMNPQYAGNTVNYGPSSNSVTVIGNGSQPKWIFPSCPPSLPNQPSDCPSNTYTAQVLDDGRNVSSYNAPSSLTVTLPPMNQVNIGWSMGFVTDNGKGMTINNSGDGSLFVSGGKNTTSLTLAASLYEYVKIEADGNAWRVEGLTRDSKLLMGYEPPPWPSKWIFNAGSSYSATINDNGSTISSYPASLTITLPSTTTIPNGWSMGFATDNGNTMTVNTNATNGGSIIFPGAHTPVTSVKMPVAGSAQAYEYMVLQYDGGGNFRVLTATPSTQQAIGMQGSPGVNRWNFQNVTSSYTAGISDNGTAFSSYNSPSSFLTVTLPPISTINPGYTLAVASDNGHVANIQVYGLNGEKILIPGLGGLSQNSISTASGQNYEFVQVMFDGSNWRVVSITPATSNAYGGLMGSATNPGDNSTCNIGQMAQGLVNGSPPTQYLYVCTQTNQWQRAVLSAY